MFLPNYIQDVVFRCEEINLFSRHDLNHYFDTAYNLEKDDNHTKKMINALSSVIEWLNDLQITYINMSLMDFDKYMCLGQSNNSLIKLINSVYSDMNNEDRTWLINLQNEQLSILSAQIDMEIIPNDIHYLGLLIKLMNDALLSLCTLNIECALKPTKCINY